MQITLIDGGIVAPEGFFASGVSCGLKKDESYDLALVCSDEAAAAAGVFTNSSLVSNSTKLTMQNIANGYASAIIINTECANMCNGEKGLIDAKTICSEASEQLDCDPSDILLASFGPVGSFFPMDNILPKLEELVGNMSEEGNADLLKAVSSDSCVSREIAAAFDIQGKEIKIGMMVRGKVGAESSDNKISAIITTDLNISKRLLQTAVSKVVEKTFAHVINGYSSSPYDVVLALANGQADNEGITEEDVSFDRFVNVLQYMCTQLSKDIIKASGTQQRLIDINVKGMSSSESARSIAESVVCNVSVADKIFAGEDCTASIISSIASASTAVFNPALFSITVSKVVTVKNGMLADYTVDSLYPQKGDISVVLDFGEGSSEYRFWISK